MAFTYQFSGALAPAEYKTWWSFGWLMRETVTWTVKPATGILTTWVTIRSQSAHTIDGITVDYWLTIWNVHTDRFAFFDVFASIEEPPLDLQTVGNAALQAR